MELLEDLFVHVEKAGAHAILTIIDDRMNKRWFTEVDPKHDGGAATWDLKLADFVTTYLSVDTTEDYGLTKDVAPERRASVAKAWAPVLDKQNKRGVKRVNVGNYMYPTPDLAKRFGVTPDQLAQAFWGGIDADYAKLHANAEALKKAIADGAELHITNPNGTDLKLKVRAAQQLLISDGVITPEMAQKGGASPQVWLPAGEFILGVVPGTGEGTVVSEHNSFNDKEVEGLKVSFKAGKLVDLSAKTNADAIKRFYDTASGKGKDELADIDFGINPSVKTVPKSKMNTFVAEGTLSIQVGNNQMLAGDNDTTFSLTLFDPGSTVTVDGKTILDKGVLKL
jgi:leucyl aminopeptidase (aminopeptidase T)